MSESGSAVLDLKDDIDDPDPVSVASSSAAPALMDGEHAPLIMEIGYDIAVKVDMPLKQLSTLETFVKYRVRCLCARWPTPPQVWRRYNHFKVLHSRLCSAHPLVATPPLPPLHSPRQQLDRYDQHFVAIRAVALDYFLNRVAKHPILSHSEDFRLFIVTPDEDLDRIFKSENSALNLWGLSSAFYGSGEAKQSNGARVKDPEFSSAMDYLQSLQQKLTTLSNLTNKLNKGTAAVGNELMSMKSVCDRWSPSSRPISLAIRAISHACLNASTVRSKRCNKHTAILPMLATYAGQHVEKIKQRNSLHAAYIAGGNNAGELHNRLEQSSEAIRSELADWNSKTRSEIKSLLIELADRQLQIQQQSLLAWENALRLATGTNIEDVFKTVSKNAVLNLSPSKSRNEIDPETELEIDDLDIDSELQDSSAKTLNGEKSSEAKLDNQVLDEKSEAEVFDEKPISEESNNRLQNRSVCDDKISKLDSESVDGDLKSDENEAPISREEEKSDAKKENETEVESIKQEVKSNVKLFTDPLQDFAEVNLEDDL